MADPIIRLTYEGGDAERHVIDARLFGLSLQGIDKLISDSLIVFSQERLPKKGERAPLILKAREPEAGSYTVLGMVADASQYLPLGLVPLLGTIGTDIISMYVASALDFFSGRDRAMEALVKAMAQMHHDEIASRDRTDERRHIEVMGMQDLVRRSIQSNGAAAVNYVAPIGPGRSVDRATFQGGENPPLLIGTPEAEKIREHEKLEWDAPGNLVLKTDGFKHHSGALSVEHPEQPGFIMAEVVDPDFAEPSNAYTAAANKLARIEVLARRAYRDDKLVKIQIIDFIREINDSEGGK